MSEAALPEPSTSGVGADTRATERSAATSVGAVSLAAGAVLLIVYLATLAPDVTFWDAGEFIAAARTLGIPHPPGTPIVMLLHNVWAKVLFFVPFAVATNSVSAIATAAAGALSAALVLESAGDAVSRRSLGWNAAAGALCAGGMSTVWLNATETEVYSVALTLSAAMLWAAQRAGRRDSTRWRALTGYLMVMSVPLHLSALVAGPTAAYLASTSADGEVDRGSLVSFAGLFLMTMGFGRMSWHIAAAGALVMLLAPLASRVAWRTSAALAGAGLVAASAVVFLLLRARFDPAINQGNPSNWATLADVIARRQYDVPGLWPRMAPVWLQVANMFQYFDWQVALSLAPGVVPNVWRVLMTVAFAALGVYGAAAHRGDDRRGWLALVILFACGSLGIAAYVNFHAGASFGYGILPANAVHEARDRDYFYYLGFWAWGLWAGYGAVELARRWRSRAAVAGLVVAALPIALNWSAVSRKQQPGAELPRKFAEAILGSAPRNAVLVVAGDNDSYPLWYVQQVQRYRRDVTLVTSPLLNASWYQREVSRRAHLLPKTWQYQAEIGSAKEVAKEALASGRPLAASVLLPASERNQLSKHWVVRGLVYLAAPGASSLPDVDSAATREWSASIEQWRRGRMPPLAIDPSDRYYTSVLTCPTMWLTAGHDEHALASLDSLCNRR